MLKVIILVILEKLPEVFSDVVQGSSNQPIENA